MWSNRGTVSRILPIEVMLTCTPDGQATFYASLSMPQGGAQEKVLWQKGHLFTITAPSATLLFAGARSGCELL